MDLFQKFSIVYLVQGNLQHCPLTLKLSAMINITRVSYSCIPLYLRRSAFYLSLDHNEGDIILDVPADCLWPDGGIKNKSEFQQYLKSMQYWGMDYLTIEGLKYCFKLCGNSYSADHLIESMEVIADVSSVKSSLYTGLCALLENINGLNEEDHWISAPLTSFDAPALTVVLPFLLDYDIGKIFCSYAAESGRTDDLIAFHTQYGPVWDEKTCTKAAYGGHMDALLYLLDHDCPCDFWTAAAAADGGHLDILQYLHDNAIGFDTQTSLWPPQVSATAAYRHLDCLKYLHLKGHPWDERACAAAARGGQLDNIKYLRENGCPWDVTAYSAAVYFDQVQMLQYLHENGCPRDEKACSRAAMTGNFEILQYLRSQNFPWGDGWSPCDFAAHKGKIETLRFAMATGCRYSENVVVKVAQSGEKSLDCLKYLLEEQLLEMDERLFHAAFQAGNIQYLRYLIDSGCPFCDSMFYPVGEPDPITFFECLTYAVEHGWCPNKAFVLFVKKNAALLRCLEYIHDVVLFCAYDPPNLDEREEV